MAVLAVAALVVAATTVVTHVAVSDEERALVLSRARDLALTVTLGVVDVHSILAMAATAGTTSGATALTGAAKPLTAKGALAGVGLVTSGPDGLVVEHGGGMLTAGMSLHGPLWERTGSATTPFVLSGAVVGEGRRLVGVVVRTGSPPAVLAAVLVADPALARVMSAGPDRALTGLAARLSAPGAPGRRPIVAMTVGDVQRRTGASVTVPVTASDTRYTLTVWPTAPQVGSLEAELQWIVLAVGAALWVLLVALARARSQSAARARALARSERQLSATVAELRDANLTDPLTGLPNRAFAHLELADRLARQRPGTPAVAVIALDLDGFTQVNDALGYGRGDQALQAVADRWRRALRPDDFLARVGGDEFVVLASLPPEQTADLGGLVEHLLQTLAGEPLALHDRVVRLRATAGLALNDDSGVVPGELLRRAGTALHTAQAQAGGGWATFDRAMDSVVSQRFGVGQELFRAIEAGELRLLYQPLVAIATDRMVGVEALLRWRRPGHGPIPPTLAVDVAESSGLIGKLGTWVLHTACRQAVAWHAAGAPPGFTVGVNVSALQVSEPDVVRAVERALTDTGCQPSWLTLEITETCLIGDVEATVATLHELRRLGCRLALDDFGTGYSSLDYLTRLPLDVLKVDRSILLPADGDLQRVAGFLAGIRSITTTIGVQALAEGVETEAQLELVRTCGFELAQGFLYGRPQAASRITRLLQQRQSPTSRARASRAAGA